MNALRLGFALASLGFPAAVQAVDDYKLTADSPPKKEVPKGKLEGPCEWKSKIFDGTTRQYWVCVPAQYDKAKAACVMDFQDGHAYALPNEGYKIPTVFDNLIAAKEMPVTIGIFINPGAKEGEPAGDAKNWGKATRSYEYDSLGWTRRTNRSASSSRMAPAICAARTT